MKRKILSAFLALVLAVTMLIFGDLPLYAAETGTPRSVELGTDAITGWDATNGYHYIYYGDSKYFNVKYGNSNKTFKQHSGDPVGAIKWRVLSGQTNMGTDDGFFLLSEYLFGQHEFGEGVIFNWFQGTVLDEHNLYQGSDAQDWCKGFGNTNFSPIEFAAVIETTKNDAYYRSPAWPTLFAAVEKNLNGDKIFFPSAQEMETPDYGFPVAYGTGPNYEDENKTRAATDTAGTSWIYWTRSRREYGGNVVNSTVGRIDNTWGSIFYQSVQTSAAARPAFNLDKSAVSFIESATGSQTVGKMTAVTDNTTREWKLNLLDSSRNFAVAEASVSGKSSGKITLNYSGAKTGTNEYISALIVNASGEVLYSGILSQASASGEVDIALPADLPAGNYTLKLFNEQANGEKMTDYVSNFADVDLTVEEPFAVFDGIQDTYFHTGLAIEPDFTLTAKQTGKTLVEGTDYTVAWENNTDIGKATVTVTYIGDHVGELAQATTFRIIPGPLPEGKTVDDYLDYNKNWQNVDPIITAKQGYSFSSTNYVDFTESAAFTGTGAFSVSVCIKDDTNNGIIYDFVPVELKVDKIAPTIRSARATQSATKASIIVQATDNHSGVAAYSFDGGVTWVTTPGTTVYKNGSYTVQVKDAAGNIATYRSPVTVSGIDEIPPTGSIQIGENTWTDFLNSNAVTFELFCSTKETVTISVQDTGGAGIKSAEYFLSETSYDSVDAILADSNIVWQSITLSEGAGEVTFSADQKAIFYLKITDNANNVNVINTDGLIIDVTAPTVEGIEDGNTYCGAVEASVSDDYLDKVTVGGNEVTVTDGKFTVPSAAGEQTVIAYDKAGNTTIYVVTVNDGHTMEYTTDLNSLIEKCAFCNHREAAELRVEPKTYDGNPIVALVNYSENWLGDRNLVVSYEVFDGEVYVSTVSVPMDAGEYRASVTYGGATAYATFKISPMVIELPEEDGREFVYNGQSHTYNIASNSAYNVSGATQTNAGQYDVEVSLVSANYVWADDTTEIKKYRFLIDKCLVEITQCDDFVYTGQLQKPDYVDDDKYTVEENDGGVDAGEYEVIFKLTAPENYKWPSTELDTFVMTYSILKTENTWKKTLSIEGWVYGDNAAAPNATAQLGETTYTYYDAEKNALAEVPVHAGNYFVKAFVADTENYNGLESDFAAFTIEQKTVSIQWNAPDSLIYDGKEKLPSAVVSGGLVGDDAPVVVVALAEGDDNVKVGSFTFTAIELTDDNYKLDADVVSPVYIIAPRALEKGDFSVDTDGLVYTGAAIKPTAESLNALVTDADFEIVYENNVLAGNETAKITITGKGNASGKVAFTFSIAKANPTISSNPSASRVFVNRTLSESVLSDGEAKGVGGAVLSGEFAWQDGTAVLDTKGTVKKTVVFTPEDENYHSVEFDVDVMVIVCDTVSGDHEYTVLKKNETEHWYVCYECDVEEIGSRVGHSGGTATCIAKAKCSVCDIEYGNIDTTNHDYASTWTKTANAHYYECSRCADRKDEGSHHYTNACDTTCNTCGYLRRITHSYTELEHNKKQHWYVCSVCGDEESGSYEAHKGGTATCTGQSLCEICRAEYGTSNGNHHSFEATLTIGENTHYYACSFCEVKKDEVAHSFADWTSNGDGTHTGACICGKTTVSDCAGGIPTCTEKAICTTCNTAYGELNPENHASGVFSYTTAHDGTHTKKYICCGVAAVTNEACSGGNATCIKKAICEYCETPYGKFADHTGGTANCTEKAVCTVCDESYGELAPDHHDFNTEWLTDEEGHFHKCSRCGEIDGKEAHEYHDDHLCVCGAKKAWNWILFLIVMICIVLVGGFAIYWFLLRKKKHHS